MSVRTAPPPRAERVAAEVARPRQRRRRQALAQVIAPVLVFALMIAIWLFISFFLLEPRRRFLMPPPQEVVRVGFFDARNLNEILSGLWSTTQVALVGLVVAIAIGTLIAVALIQARWIE